MSNDKDLFGKTYDQQVKIAGEEIQTRDISPNRRISGEIVFEPLGKGVRVTARDNQHRVLWGYVGAKETVKEIHCLVAVYDALQNFLKEELEKNAQFQKSVEDPIHEATTAIDQIEKTIKWIRESLDVKQVSDATNERAQMIAQILTDANRQITLEASLLRGMKSKI